MRLNSKRVNFEYQPGEEIFTFPEDTELPRRYLLTNMFQGFLELRQEALTKQERI